jgi:hypothetical protein
MYKPFAHADSTFRLLEPVQQAPSVFNTQPWWFRILADDRLDVCARVGEGSAYQHLREHGLELTDGDRRLSSIDPGSRELIMSCGAALCNLRLAIRTAGHDLTVSRPWNSRPPSTGAGSGCSAGLRSGDGCEKRRARIPRCVPTPSTPPNLSGGPTRAIATSVFPQPLSGRPAPPTVAGTRPLRRSGTSAARPRPDQPGQSRTGVPRPTRSQAGITGGGSSVFRS